MSESQEVIVGRLDERMVGMQKEMSQLVDTVRTLTDAVTALTKEGARIDTVQTQVSALLRGQEDLWREIGKLHDKLIAHQQAQARASAGGLFEVIKLIVAGSIGVAVARFGR